MAKILWADDEIELLLPHIIFLRNKGYEVIAVQSGDEAVDRVKEEEFEIIFLDEKGPNICFVRFQTHFWLSYNTKNTREA